VAAVVGTAVLIGVLVWRCTQRGKGEYMDPSMELEMEGGRRLGGITDGVETDGVELESEDSEGEKGKVEGKDLLSG